MAGCCGRPSNNAAKGAGEANYYERFAYLSSHQKEKQAAMSGSKCMTCDAYTMGDPCAVCGDTKTEKEG